MGTREPCIGGQFMQQLLPPPVLLCNLFCIQRPERIRLSVPIRIRNLRSRFLTCHLSIGPHGYCALPLAGQSQPLPQLLHHRHPLRAQRNCAYHPVGLFPHTCLRERLTSAPSAHVPFRDAPQWIPPRALPADEARRSCRRRPELDPPARGEKRARRLLGPLPLTSLRKALSEYPQRSPPFPIVPPRTRRLLLSTLLCKSLTRHPQRQSPLLPDIQRPRYHGCLLPPVGGRERHTHLTECPGPFHLILDRRGDRDCLLPTLDPDAGQTRGLAIFISLRQRLQSLPYPSARSSHPLSVRSIPGCICARSMGGIIASIRSQITSACAHNCCWENARTSSLRSGIA